MIYKLKGGNTLPSLLSILLLLREKGKRNEPKEDAWGKEKERVLKLTDKIKQENSWMGKTADILHHIGVGATGLGLLGSFITAPAATALGLIGGIAGEQAVNKATKKVSNFLTNGKGKTWNEYAELLGLSPTLAAFTNPGGLIGGAKASKLRIKPGYVMVNPMLEKPFDPKGKPLEYIVMKLRSGKMTDLDLSQYLNAKLILDLKLGLPKFGNAITEPRSLRPLLLKLAKGLKKGTKGGNEEYRQASFQDKRASGDAAAVYKDIQDRYSGIFLEHAEQTKSDYGAPINWDWFSGGILSKRNIPEALAVASPRDTRGIIVEDVPIMELFYKNALDIIATVLKDLISNKHMWVDPKTNLWTGRDPITGYVGPIDPSRFVLNFINLNSTNRIPYWRIKSRYTGNIVEPIAWHGTRGAGDASVMSSHANPSKQPLFTTVSDDSPGYRSLKTAYLGSGGASLPVAFKSKAYETEPLISSGTNNSSNNYGTYGELNKHFLTNGGKASLVRNVSDANAKLPGNTGLKLNEYDFGEGTPHIKFLLNTLKFDESSPYASAFMKKGGKSKLIKRYV